MTTDTPAASGSGDVQAVRIRTALTDVQGWFAPMTPVYVKLAVERAIPALNAIEAALKDCVPKASLEAALAEHADWAMTAEERAEAAESSLARCQDALQDARDYITIGSFTYDARRQVVARIDAALGEAPAPAGNGEVALEESYRQTVQCVIQRDEFIVEMGLWGTFIEWEVKQRFAAAKATPAPEREGEDLAVSLHAKHYAEVTHWRPLAGDLIGLLTQIDNMTTGLCRATPAAPDRAVDALREARAIEAAVDAVAYHFYPGKEINRDKARDHFKCALAVYRAALQGDVGTGRT
jgi:hypothetical protein